MSRDLFKGDCEFRIGATKIEDIPAANLPEVAFAGRSNVGKSSLLNALTKRKSLARTSKTPGCTKQLNFFLLGEKIYLVDLPGYGYARASRKDVQGWGELAIQYLIGRPNLSRVFLLIDSRHGVKPNDIQIMEILDEAAVSYQIILTKTDKQSENGLQKIVTDINNLAPGHTALHPEILQTSSVNYDGLDELRRIISGFC